MSIEDLTCLTNKILDLAININIIDVEENLEKSSDRQLRLKIGTESPRSVEAAIEEQYMKSICNERSPTNALQEYKEYVRTDKGSLDYFLSNKQRSELA